MAETIEQQQAIALATARLRLSQAQPEQGNMYTQGAEDIQYSPEGIPLSTSSYGSANPYQKTTKALNTLVSTPLNIATGAAKLPAAVVQTYDKYIGGGNTGDNMVNTINQIESGTQAQAGNIGKPLLQGSSIVGEVAPYMLSPVKTGAPTFLEQTAAKVAPTIANYTQKGGQLVDNAIGMLPSFAQKVLPSANLVGNVAKGVGIGGATALTSPETVGLTPEQFAQAKENKIKTGMAIGGGLPIVGNALSALNTSTGLNLGRKLAEAPSADELLEKSKRLFGEAKDMGVEINANKFSADMGKVARELENEGFDRDLFPRIQTVLDRLQDTTTAKDLNKLQSLRKMIATIQKSDQSEERRFASMLKGDFDYYMANLPEQKVAGGTKEALDKWKEARDTYAQLSKGDIFEAMIEKARTQKNVLTQSGEENALFKELRKLAENPKRLRLFNKAEQAEIKQATEGGSVQNAMRFMARFTPTGPVSGMFAGGAMLANPAVAIPFEVASVLSKAGATKIRKDDVKKLAAMMRAGKMPEMVSNPMLSQQQQDLAKLLLLQGTERSMNK
jgi:predicted peroxiredoxin